MDELSGGRAFYGEAIGILMAFIKKRFEGFM
jgi:hypothetical protein